MARVCKAIKELGKIITGKTPSTAEEENWGGNIPFITPTDIPSFDTYHQERTARYVSNIGVSKQKKTLLPSNAICITCIASVGKPCITKGPSITNQQINAIITNNKNDYRYVYYLMRYNLPYLLMVAGGSGTGTPIISKSMFSRFKFVVEDDLAIQRAIARRLSAYDELIENNRKRIDLLEKKAALLYKEWFVRRRFPGHDQVKWIDGLPEGWKVERLGDWYSTSSGGTPLRSEPTYFENGKYMWVKTGELLDRFIIDTEEKITEEAIAKSAAKLISPGSLLCSMYAGVGKLGIAAKEMTCSQATCVFNPRSFCTNYYLFFFLKLNKAYLENISFGAAQQNISQEIIRKIKLNIPTEKVIVAFTEKVEGIYRTILNLQEQNALLAKKRDLLLPRLMSGRVTP